MVLLLLTGLALTGCKAFERDHPAADTASRNKSKPTQGWLGGPTPGVGKVGTPPADSWANPRDPLYDVQREVRGVLGGFVEDPDGRKVKDAFIEVEPVGGAADGAPVGVQTDKLGQFLIKGLQPGQTYQLTARIKLDGRDLAGRVFAKTGNERSQFVRLALIDGLTFPGDTTGRDLPGGTDGAKSGTGTVVPPPPVIPSGTPKPEPLTRSADEGLPSRAPTEPTPKPVVVPAPVPTRTDLTADRGEPTWKPPVASIPSAVAPSPPKKPEIKPTPPEGQILLLDTLGVQRGFPSGKPGELVLMAFMTTTGLPSKQSIPIIKDLQARYGLNGVEVIGIVCDDSDSTQRRVLGAAYQRAEGLNFLLYAEPTKDPGPVMKKYNVKLIPTLVLIESQGAVLWSGKPADRDALEKVLTTELAKRK